MLGQYFCHLFLIHGASHRRLSRFGFVVEIASISFSHPDLIDLKVTRQSTQPTGAESGANSKSVGVTTGPHEKREPEDCTKWLAILLVSFLALICHSTHFEFLTTGTSS